MPKLIDANGNEFWFITELDGPWQVTSNWTGDGCATKSEWGIVDVTTGKYRKVGPVATSTRHSRVNYFDRAKDLAARMNEAHRKDVSEKTLGYNTNELRDLISYAVSAGITEDGAACYNMGVPGLCRRLEEINRMLKTLRDRLDTVDRHDYWVHQSISKYAIRNIMLKRDSATNDYVIDLRVMADGAE